MNPSRFGTICLLMLLVLAGFQNCAETPAAPVLTVDRETVSSLTSERGQLSEETDRIVSLIEEELSCSVAADCEVLTVKAACELAVVSSRGREDRAVLRALVAQHQTDWRVFRTRAERFPELSWVCAQGTADVEPACEASRCVLRERTAP